MRTASGLPLRVLTHNIRYATSAPFKGEEFWETRKSRLVNELRFSSKHCAEAFVCLQEVLHNQLLDIKCGLNANQDEWDYVGVGRDDGKTAGEYSPIFYRPGVWKLQTWTTVWLSETPEKPSKGWDAASTRIVTIALFQHRQTHKRVLALCTHLDDQGQISRLRAAQMILDQIYKYADQGSHQPPLPVFLAGDFNSEPHQEAYQVINAGNSPMADLFELIPESERYGDENTFTGFDPIRTRPKRIDFLFFSGRNGKETAAEEVDASRERSQRWIAQCYSVLPNRFEEGIFNSDHRAVVGDVILI